MGRSRQKLKRVRENYIRTVKKRTTQQQEHGSQKTEETKISFMRQVQKQNNKCRDSNNNKNRKR